MSHDEVLLPSSLTKPYLEVQIQNDLTLWRVQALGGKQNSQLTQSFEPSHTRLIHPLEKLLAGKKTQNHTNIFLPCVLLNFLLYQQ